MKIILIFFLIINYALASQCFESNNGDSLSCQHKMIKLDGLYAKREILYAIPDTPRPERGYPVALFFQGSFFPMQFERNKNDPFGGYNEILTIKALLDNGFIVIAPKAGANFFWQSNLIGLNYDLSSDKYLIDKIIGEIKNQSFGPADTENLFALGISSGGYMTDRMAQSHNHAEFKALAIAAASYAKCGGPYCPLPSEISVFHPPTLFLHGKRDLIVPLYTMEKYEKLLRENHVITKKIIHETATHQWIQESPDAVISWFKRFLD